VPRKLIIALLAGAGFIGVLVSRLPARWLLSLASSTISCSVVDGSVWAGTCAGMAVQGRPIGDVLWTLHPLALLAGKLGAHVVLTSGPILAQADVEARGSSNVTARNVVADLPLDPAAIPLVPPTLRGTAHLDLARVTLAGGTITQLHGRIELHDIEEHTRGTTRLGSYSITFPEGQGIPPAQLHDLGGGPLSVVGTVQLTLQPGFRGRYTVQGLVAARPGAPAELKQNLMMLGSPDAQGMRPFAQEGTF
jgi:hypothetical protein